MTQNQWPNKSSSLVLPKLTTFGHSYRSATWLAGNTAAKQANRATGKLASLLGVPSSVEVANNFSVGGAALMRGDQTQSNSGGAFSQAQSSGGYMSVLNNNVVTRDAAPYLSPLGVCVMQWGVNDVMYFGGTTGFLAGWRAVLECVISRARAGSVYDDNHASITYSPNWASFTNNGNVGTGSGAHTNTIPGEFFTLNVPADFEGGTVAFAVIAGGGYYGNHQVTVDSVRRPEFDLNSSPGNGFSVLGNDLFRPVCRRITGLSPGAHTIKVVLETINGGVAFFDSWWIEANPAPYIIIADQSLPRDYSAYVTPINMPTDAAISAVNAANRTVASLFTDGRVITDNLETFLPRTAGYWCVDRLHPNERSEGLVAPKWLNLLASITGGDPGLGLLATT